MKCIKKDGAIRRVPDSLATALVKEKGWEYTNKMEFKNSVKERKESKNGKTD